MLSQILGTSSITEETPCDPEKVLSPNDSDERNSTSTKTLDGAPGSGNSTPTGNKQPHGANENVEQQQENKSEGNVPSYFENLFQACKENLESGSSATSGVSIEIPLDMLFNKMTEGFAYSSVEYPGIDTDIDDVQEELLDSTYYTDDGCPSIMCDSTQFTALMQEIIGTDESSDESGGDGSDEDRNTTLIHIVMHNDEPISFHATEQDAINAMWEWAKRELVRDLADTCCHIKVGTDPSQLAIQSRSRFAWLPIYRDSHSFYVVPVRGYLE